MSENFAGFESTKIIAVENTGEIGTYVVSRGASELQGSISGSVHKRLARNNSEK